MEKIWFDLGREMVTFDRPGQKGTESYPGLKEKGSAILQLIEPDSRQPIGMEFDLESKTVSIQYSIDDIPEDDLFTTMGYAKADMANVANIVNAFINGMVSEDLFNKLLDAEGEQDESSPEVKEFLKTLGFDENNK